MKHAPESGADFFIPKFCADIPAFAEPDLFTVTHSRRILDFTPSCLPSPHLNLASPNSLLLRILPPNPCPSRDTDPASLPSDSASQVSPLLSHLPTARDMPTRQVRH